MVLQSSSRTAQVKAGVHGRVEWTVHGGMARNRGERAVRVYAPLARFRVLDTDPEIWNSLMLLCCMTEHLGEIVQFENLRKTRSQKLAKLCLREAIRMVRTWLAHPRFEEWPRWCNFLRPVESRVYEEAKDKTKAADGDGWQDLTLTCSGGGLFPAIHLLN